MYTPVNPSFTSYIKWGIRGCKLHGQVSMMHCSGPITSVGEDRAIIFSAFACGLCDVMRGFLSLLVLGMGCVILL